MTLPPVCRSVSNHAGFLRDDRSERQFTLEDSGLLRMNLGFSHRFIQPWNRRPRVLHERGQRRNRQAHPCGAGHACAREDPKALCIAFEFMKLEHLFRRESQEPTGRVGKLAR